MVSDKSTSISLVPIILFSHIDFRFRGPKGSEYRVGTVIPSHDANFRNLERLKSEIDKVMESSPTHNVSLEISFSDRPFRDTVRNQNATLVLEGIVSAIPRESILDFDNQQPSNAKATWKDKSITSINGIDARTMYCGVYISFEHPIIKERLSNGSERVLLSSNQIFYKIIR